MSPCTPVDPIPQTEWAMAFADAYLWLDPGKPRHQVLYDWGCLLWEENGNKDPEAFARTKFNVLQNSRRI